MNIIHIKNFLKVYTDLIISTIVDPMPVDENGEEVYTDLIISTIVD